MIPEQHEAYEHRAAAQRLKALAASVPESADTLQPYIDYHETSAAALESMQYRAVSPSKALSGDEVGNYPFLYRKSATGAVERRTVHIAAPPARPSSAIVWIDPPYDR